MKPNPLFSYSPNAEYSSQELAIESEIFRNGTLLDLDDQLKGLIEKGGFGSVTTTKALKLDKLLMVCSGEDSTVFLMEDT